MLFTNSPCYEQYASTNHIETSSEFKVNKFGLPILKTMFETVTHKYTYDYLGYLNSDILIHPDIFSVLDTVSNAVKDGIFPPSFILASRVANVNVRRSMSVFCQFKRSCRIMFAKLKKYSKIRTPTSAVRIIFQYYK